MLSRSGTISLIYIARFFFLIRSLSMIVKSTNAVSYIRISCFQNCSAPGGGAGCTHRDYTPTSRFHEHIASWGCWRFVLSSPFSSLCPYTSVRSQYRWQILHGLQTQT
jgi:hypothetical protein